MQVSKLATKTNKRYGQAQEVIQQILKLVAIAMCSSTGNEENKYEEKFIPHIFNSYQ